MRKKTMLLLTVLLILSCNKFKTAEEKLSLPKKQIPMQTKCSIDTINNILINQKQQPIVIFLEENVVVSGWAVDILAKSVAGGVIIDIDGQLYEAYYGGERQDVADFLKNQAYRYSLFASSFPASTIGRGKHILSLKVITNDKTAYYSSEQKVLLQIK
jgi:hypothetical protein